MQRDTIAAIATASGPGGISIVRISGPEALEIADAVFRCPGESPSARASHTVAHGQVVAEDGEVMDEALLLVFRAPRSYTAEDVVELQGHGGTMSAERVLRTVLAAGARSAEAGEFTQRAFLNGRIDLVQAEAVADLIRAGSERAAGNAIRQLHGLLSNLFNDVYDSTISICADLESTLDFSDEELPDRVYTGIEKDLKSVEERLNKLLKTWKEGQLLRQGALIVISGKPNAGKSTLLNRLLGHERAIVSAVPGTTRDSIEEQIVLRGVYARVTDTAGLRETDCHVEREGVRRARSLIDEADIRVHLIDATAGLDDEDRAELATLAPEKSMVIVNKADLADTSTLVAEITHARVLATSLQNPSIDPLITSGLGDILAADLHAPANGAISERHRAMVIEAHAAVQSAAAVLAGDHNEGAVIAAQHLRAAAEALGLVTGRVFHDELLSNIFSRFCVGK